MITFKRHIPDSFRSFDVEEIVELLPKQYDSFDDILALDWIKAIQDENFERFSLSRYSSHPEYVLMVEQKDGSFWVMGFVDEDIPELPTWTYKNENN